MTQMIRRRLPIFKDVLPVYAITAFMVYGWTFFTYFRYLHYWLQFLNISEIFAIFCYAMLADLAESLLILFILMCICFVLPSRFLKDAFVVRGTLIVICVLGSILVFLNNFPDLDAYMITVLPWTGVTILVAALVAYFAVRSRFIVRTVAWFSDSMIIFLYIFVPLTALSLLVVLVRNLA